MGPRDRPAVARDRQQRKDDVAHAARDRDGQDDEDEDEAGLMEPVPQAETDEVQERGGAGHQHVGRVRKERGTDDMVGRQEARRDADQREGQHELRMLDDADVHLHGSAHQEAREVRHEDVADAADDDRAEEPDDAGLPEPALVFPEHGGGRRGREKHVRGVENVEEVLEGRREASLDGGVVRRAEKREDGHQHHAADR